jgi:hypothetical protein
MPFLSFFFFFFFFFFLNFVDSFLMLNVKYLDEVPEEIRICSFNSFQLFYNFIPLVQCRVMMVKM